MRDRRLLVVGIVALVIGFAGMAIAAPSLSGEYRSLHGAMMGWSGSGPGPEAPPTASDVETVTVVADEFSYAPNRLVVSRGRFNLALVNEGSVFHDLTITEIGIHLNADRGATVAGGYENVPAGEYRFFCTVPGHAEAGMAGILVIEG